MTHPMPSGLRRLRPVRAAGVSMGGFTLLELMVVVTIVALASTGVTLALRENDAQRLETEALRLSALLESARAQSRSEGTPVIWRPTASGFEWLERSAGDATSGQSTSRPRQWLQPEVKATILQPPGALSLVLGPEPLIMAQQLELQLGERKLVLATDGLSTFAPLDASTAP